MKMMMNGMEHEMLMPGMLTAEQMHAARGRAGDRSSIDSFSPS